MITIAPFKHKQRMQRCSELLANLNTKVSSSLRTKSSVVESLGIHSSISTTHNDYMCTTSTAFKNGNNLLNQQQRSIMIVPYNNLPSMAKEREKVHEPFNLNRDNYICSLTRAGFSSTSDTNKDNDNPETTILGTSSSLGEQKSRNDHDPNDSVKNKNHNSISRIVGEEPTMEVSKEKLRQLLHELGMSISQWNVHNNYSSSKNNNVKSATTSHSPKRPDRRQRKQPRVNEEFDVYGGYNNYRRRSSSSSNSDSITNTHNLPSEKISARMRVRSVHAAHTIDIVSVLTKVFGTMSQMPSIRHMFSKTSLIVQLPSIMEQTSSSSSSSSYSDVDAFFHPQAQPRFIAIFRYGSIVFFNVNPKDAGRILDKIKDYSTDPIARSFERKEHFEIAISPQMMVHDAHVTSDFATVKELNINTVAVISTVMGQTVAFDSYNDVVDELLSTFDDVNSTVKKTGNFTDMQKETLFKVVAQNNSIFIDMIAKLGIKDRSDTAWNMSQYERIHEGMKHEFEIESRFEYIEFKLNLIQQNAKFFLEILHNQKTDTLE